MSPLHELLLAIALAASHAQAGATPIMGYNSYNQVSCSPNENSMTSIINAMASRGFVAAGYKYFQIDCGWAARDGQRDPSTGALKVDTKAFPSGLKKLSDLARSKGMKWSMYSNAGYRMCDPQVPSPVLGSLGHERVDAELFKSLNTEYLKYDNCYADGAAASQNAPKNPRTDFPSRFSVMWNELKRVGIPELLVCQWGTPQSAATGLQGPNDWTKGISTSFRLSDDIQKGWSHTYRIYNQVIHIAKSGLIGPGHYADADMLEVGNSGMTQDEQATHFAAWAMFKSALMISTDVASLSDTFVKILQNKGLIAINQDSLGKPITLVQRWTNDRDLWVGELANGDKAVLLVDLSNSAKTQTVDLSALGIASADIRDLWTDQLTTGASRFSKSVAAHGSIALRLSNIKTQSVTAPTVKWVSASTGTLASGAQTASCSGCATSTKVGYIGGSNGGSVTLSNIYTSQATQTVLFDYINGDVGYMGGTNERLASVRVNNGPAQTISFPLSGYNWDRDVMKNYRVQLSGFNTNGPNTIVIGSAGSVFGPDLDRIGVVA